MSIKIGTGPNAWGVRRDPNQPDRVPWRRFLDEVVEAGYDWIEVGHYGYLPTDARTLRAELDSRGLNAIAATAMAGHLDHPSDWPRIETTVTRIGEVAASAGAKYLVLIDDSYTAPGSRVSAPETDDDGWKCLVEAIHRAADMVRERFALEMTFHPHADTHVETEEQTELLLEQSDPGRVSLCLDTGHSAYTGGEPVAFMRKHHERIRYLHLKDVNGDTIKRVRAERLPMSESVPLGVFCEFTEGIVDFEALAEVVREVGYDGWATVEQDMYQPRDRPLNIATRTRSYLRKIGMG